MPTFPPRKRGGESETEDAMKVLAVNGSPNAHGNTRTAIDVVAGELASKGVECEVVHIGNKAIRGCIACGMCAKNKDKRCALPDDGINELVAAMSAADGFILGSPVHFASISGTMKSAMDRAFYVSGNNGNLFRHKVGAALAAVRRTGGIAAFDQLNHYLLYAELLVPSANYWNVIHGAKPGEAAQDVEGVQALQLLGRNMAWLLSLRAGQPGPEPEREAKIRMNFIR
jgi:multimeric flavodoxin WrbA